jgi:hypothetical protein
MMVVMERSRVRLPTAVRPPYTVFVNGVAQREGVDYVVVDGFLEFHAALQKEEKLSVWRWFLGAFGIGTYGRNDQVDVTWDVAGRPRIAHALDIEPAPEPVARRGD